MLTFFLVGCAASDPTATKTVIIGQAAEITVTESGLSFQARIDTGAQVTSLHAYDIFVHDGVADQPHQHNVGKQGLLRLQTAKTATITTTIVDIATVRSSKGTEDRYEVELSMRWQDISKTIRVNLRDRSHLTFPLLIGRNWLQSTIPPKILVDSDLNELQKTPLTLLQRRGSYG